VPSRGPILDFPVVAQVPASRPTVSLPSTVKSSVKKAPTPKLTGHRVRGGASWYCQTGVSACHRDYPGGMYAAAGAALRVGSWRGRQVRVCAGTDCIWVRLIDWCACGNGHIIDLYSDAFRRLAPLNTGVVRVTVSW
jgi:rare lipoprotein A (peptidoglycan hydrolase)